MRNRYAKWGACGEATRCGAVCESAPSCSLRHSPCAWRWPRARARRALPALPRRSITKPRPVLRLDDLRPPRCEPTPVSDPDLSAYDDEVDVAYSPGEWGNFATGMATASGALTGLVFVAVSIRVTEVLGDRFHRRRAESTFVILLSTLTASLCLLIPGQTRVAVGIELLLIACTARVSGPSHLADRPHVCAG